MGEGLGRHSSSVCLEREGCSSHRHNRFQRSHFLPSLRSLFRATKAAETVPMGRQQCPSSCRAWELCLGLCARCRKQRSASARWAGTPGTLQHELSHHLSFFSSPPVAHQVPAVTHGAGWPRPGFGLGDEPIGRLHKTWRWLVTRSSVAQSLSDEDCMAYMLSAGDSFKGGGRIKSKTPGPFWILAVCRGCLHPCQLVFLVTSRMMSISPLFLQFPGSLPACSKSFLPQLSNPGLFQPVVFALVSGKPTPLLSCHQKG